MELADTGVIVTALQPGSTESAFVGRAGKQQARLHGKLGEPK